MAIAIDVANLGEFASDTSGASVSCTTTSSTAAGSRVIVAGTLIFPNTVLSVADDGPGLSWAIDTQALITGPSQAQGFIASASAPGGLPSGTVITVTFSGSVPGGRSVVASSFTGIHPSSPVDAISAQTETVATTAWTTSSTAIQSGSLLFALSIDFSNLFTSTPTDPSIEAHDVGDGAGFAITTCYRIQSAAGTYTVAGTWSSACNGGVIAVAYRSSGLDYQRLYGPAQLDITPTDLYTVPQGARTTIRHIYINNPSGATVKPSLAITAGALSDFTGADEDPLSEGGVWAGTARISSAAIDDARRLSNAAAPSTTASTASEACWGATFNADQEVYFTVTALPQSGQYVELHARIQNRGLFNVIYYIFVYVVGTGIQFYKLTYPTGFTQLGATVSQTLSVGDEFRLRVTGTTLEGFVNGVSVGTRTDSDIAGEGLIGFALGAAGDTARIDGFGGGDQGLFLDLQDIPAGRAFVIRRHAQHTLEAGETVQGYADVDATAVIVLDGYVEDV